MPSLLDTVSNVISRLYGFEPVPDPARFIIGDGGFDRLYGGAPLALRVGAPQGGAMMLLRPSREELRVSIYYPDALIEALEQHDPCRSLHDDNIDAFLGFVEELDHFQLVAHKWRWQQEFSLLELELHANVTKHVVARWFLRRQRGEVDAQGKQWLAYHLFHKQEFTEPDEGVRARYRDAHRLGLRYTRYLGTLPAAARLRELRRWTAAPPQAKVACIESLPALRAD